MNVSLIGPSGAGKGTHIARLRACYGLLHVATGDLFRENLEQTTALGLLARKFMNEGELVPDEIVDAMVEEKLRKTPQGTSVLFDGFPRTVYQAKFLDAFFKETGQALDAVIYLRVSDDQIITRLSGRVICHQCLRPFHKTLAPFTTCPFHKCKGEHLFQRDDDQSETARTRLRVFHRVTGPLIDYFQKTHRLIILDGDGDPRSVEANLLRAFEGIRAGQSSWATAEEAAWVRGFGIPVRPPTTEQPLRRSLDLVLLGGPGSGKGTQAEQLTKHFKLRHIASGDLFRHHLKLQTELGKLAKAYMDRGDLVPDDVTDAMLSERLAQPDASDGSILDGYPRTLHQAEALSEILSSLRRALSAVLYIKVPDEEIVKRLSGRLICRQCQTPCHLEFKPPARSGFCDLCNGPLYQRDDDNPETVRARLKTFHAQTEPLIDYYKQAGLLSEINGAGNVSEVTSRTIAAVNRISNSGEFLQPSRPVKP